MISAILVYKMSCNCIELPLCSKVICNMMPYLASNGWSRDQGLGTLPSPELISGHGMRYAGNWIHYIHCSPSCFSPQKERKMTPIMNSVCLPKGCPIDPLCNSILLQGIGRRNLMVGYRGGMKFLDNMGSELLTIARAKCINLHCIHRLTL